MPECNNHAGKNFEKFSQQFVDLVSTITYNAKREQIRGLRCSSPTKRYLSSQFSSSKTSVTWRFLRMSCNVIWVSFHAHALAGNLLKLATMISSLLTAISVGSQTQGQETDRNNGITAVVKGEDKTFNLDRTFTYRGIPEISHLDLGVLESDSEGHVKITLVNESPDEFRVSAIEVSCSCVEATMPNEILAPGKSSVLTVKLKVPKQATAAVQTQNILVRQDSDRAMQVNLRYKLGMICSFPKSSATVVVPFEQTKVKFSLPVLITSPLTRADIRIYGEGDLKNCTAELSEAGDYFIVECRLDVPAEGKFTKTGRMVIENLKSRSRSECDCFILRADEVSVAPTTTHFFQIEGAYKATAIVRVNRLLAKTSDSGASSGISIAVSADQLKLNVESKEIGNGGSRVRLSFDASVLEKLRKEKGANWIPRSLHWQVAWDGGISEFTTPFSLSYK